MPKYHVNALASALSRALTDASNSADIARSWALSRIIEKEHSYGLEGLLRTVSRDPVDFILVAAPGFSRDLKLATGRDRNEWADLIS